MTRLFLFMLLSVVALYAFDSIEVLNPNITVHKSGYFKTDKDLTPEQALKIAKEGNLSELPQKASSFGFDRNEYWFIFEVSTISNGQFFLESKNIVGDYQDMFVFDGETIIKSQKNGHLTPINKRYVKVFPIRFELENSSNNLTYLLKIKSKNPLVTSFAFGNTAELDGDWQINYAIFIFTFGVFTALIFYNAFLYFTIRDKSYLYYCFYMTGLFLADIVQLGYLPLISQYATQNFSIFMMPLTLFTHAGLTFFAIHFLKLKERHNKLRLILLSLLLLSAVLSIASIFGIANTPFVFSIQAIYLMSIYVGVVSYRAGFKPALYYLFATGIGLVFLIIFMNMCQGIGVEFSLVGMNLLNISMIWDLVLLSFALAYRVRLLQKDNIQQERLLMIHSRQDSIGEITGNIAHQWRSPIGELGAILTKIQAKLLYGEIPKDELLESISQSNSIIRHLSGTIDTFQSFFQNSPNKDSFEANEQMDRIIKLLADSLQNNGIKVEFVHCEQCVVIGKDNEFAQVLLNIILNAKDVLVGRNIQDKKINIHCHKEKSHVVIEVLDNAGGINIKPIEKIFEPYITDKIGGTGVGLFIAKTIVEQKLGGKIRVENSNIGACFSIKLPV